MIDLKRAYDEPEDTDGYRILVDRLWPRGESKDKAHFDLWLKEVAPSKELREWFHHDPNKFSSFREKYLKELASGTTGQTFQELKKIVKEHPVVTLIYSAKNTQCNHAIVLKEALEQNL